MQISELNQIQLEAINVVNKINNELKAKYNKKNQKDIYKDWKSITPELAIILFGDNVLISLCIPYDLDDVAIPEIRLWDSTNDTRAFDAKDERVSLYKHIKQRFLSFKSYLNSVKL